MNLKKAAKIQERLARKVRLAWEGDEIHSVAGADVASLRGGDLLAAAVVVLGYPGLEVLESAFALEKPRLPYIPGYLSFREGSCLVRALRRLKIRPDVTLLDGNGIAHPRRLGLASCVGVLLDIPTIGCAKSPFFPFKPPGEERGAWTVFRNHQGEQVGFCLRTRQRVKPVFVSPGHRTDFLLSREIVLASSRFRIPEPLRRAHTAARLALLEFR